MRSSNTIGGECGISSSTLYFVQSSIIENPSENDADIAAAKGKRITHCQPYRCARCRWSTQGKLAECRIKLAIIDMRNGLIHIRAAEQQPAESCFCRAGRTECVPG